MKRRVPAKQSTVLGRVLALAIAVAAASSAVTALAVWSAASAGTAAAQADVMPAGITPTASASGNRVDLTWSTSKFANGDPVEGYTIWRYNATSPGSPTAVSGRCASGTSTWTCSELGVPSGAWQYTIIPIQGGWSGAESPRSNTVNVP